MRGVLRIPVLRGIAHRARRRKNLRERVHGVEVALRENRPLEAGLEARLDELERDLVGVIAARLDAHPPPERP